jgi:hypothetical protein
LSFRDWTAYADLLAEPAPIQKLAVLRNAISLTNREGFQSSYSCHFEKR